jgi:hypothetical protein
LVPTTEEWLPPPPPLLLTVGILVLLPLPLGGGVAEEKDSDIVVVGESEELDDRCLPIRIFSTVKLEMDLFGCFLAELED